MLEVRSQTGPDSRDHRKTRSHHFVVNPDTGITVGSFSQKWNAWDCACWKPFLDAGTVPLVAPSGLFQDNKGPGGKIGYTSDPRGNVRTIPIDTATAEQIHGARLAVRKFIHAHTSISNAEVFTMSDTDYFEHHPGQYETDLVALTTEDEEAAMEAQAEAWALKQEAEKAEPEPEPEELPHDAQPPSTPLPEEAPEETPETPAETPTAEDEATTPPDPAEAAREALSDSDRNAYDNYAELAEDATSESARAFWQSAADEILWGE